MKRLKMNYFRAIHFMEIIAVVINIDENFFRPTDENFSGSLNAKDAGVMGDGLTDDTLPVQYFLNRAWEETRDAFFPPGEYMIGANILVNGNMNVYGSVKGLTVFKAIASKYVNISIGNTIPNAKLSNFSITNIFFNGVKVDFAGRFYKHNILLSNCVFFSSRRAKLPAVEPLNMYLNWHRVQDGIVRDTIFLRSKATYGIGCGFFKTYGMKIHDNVFGLDMSNLAWLASQYLGFHSWNQLIEKLHFIKKYYAMASDQGQYRSCIYGNHDDNIRIERNIFNGSPYVENLRDHVIYLKGFDGLSILGNYARGWPSDPSGGFKMRNGENLVVARNYLVDTSILLYTHNETCSYAYLHLGLSNVLIYGNHLVETRNVGAWGTGISYFEPHKVGKDTNIVIATNVFEISPRLNEGYRRLNEGYRRLNEGYRRLNERYRRLNEGYRQFNEEHTQLNEGHTQLNEGHAQLNEGHAQLNEGHTQLNEGHTQLNEGHAQLNEGHTQLNEGHTELNEGHAQLNEGHAQLNDGHTQSDDNPQMDNTFRPVGIHITNGNTREHHVFRDNVYFGTSIPVKLASSGEIRYENGLPDARLVSPYMNIAIPNFMIPDYGQGKQRPFIRER